MATKSLLHSPTQIRAKAHPGHQAKFESQYFAVALVDHRIYDQYAEHYLGLCAAGSVAEVRVYLTAIRQFVNEKLLSHIAFEEQRIFPALLANIPTAEVARQVAALRAEHKRLRAQIKQLNALFDADPPPANQFPLLKEAMRLLLVNNSKHVHQEDELYGLMLEWHRRSP